MSIPRGPTDDELGQACRRLFDRLETALALLAVPAEVQCGIARRFVAGDEDRPFGHPSRLTIAVPKLDSGACAVAMGQRSLGVPTGLRQLVFATEYADIAISLHRRSGSARLDLNGQVYPTGGRDDTCMEAVLLRGGDEAAKASTDELGEFSFEAVAPGEYYMLLCDAAAGDLTVVPLLMNM